MRAVTQFCGDEKVYDYGTATGKNRLCQICCVVDASFSQKGEVMLLSISSLCFSLYHSFSCLTNLSIHKEPEDTSVLEFLQTTALMSLTHLLIDI